jgi:hypothetical protein
MQWPNSKLHDEPPDDLLEELAAVVSVPRLPHIPSASVSIGTSVIPSRGPAEPGARGVMHLAVLLARVAALKATHDFAHRRAPLPVAIAAAALLVSGRHTSEAVAHPT